MPLFVDSFILVSGSHAGLMESEPLGRYETCCVVLFQLGAVIFMH